MQKSEAFPPPTLRRSALHGLPELEAKRLVLPIVRMGTVSEHDIDTNGRGFLLLLWGADAQAKREVEKLILRESGNG
ncbi:MAG: hypothetical protein ACLR8L_00145 [Oscillospiraceae bacterium]